MVERASAVIGHVDAADARIERDLRVLGGLDALDDDGRFRMALVEALDQRPVERGLDVMLGLAAAGPARIALHQVALAPRIVREVDREAELRRVARVLRALVVVVDELVVAAHIELEDLVGLRRALRDLLQRRLGRRALHHRDAELAGGFRHRRDAALPEQLQPPDRRDEHRQAHLAAEQRGGAVDGAHIAQHARLERDRIERLAIARERRLGLGPAGDVVPIVAIEVEPCGLEELVQVLKTLANVVHSLPRFRPTGDDGPASHRPFPCA